MDPFAKFPTEIICQILESCCDFTSLDGLQQISPRVKEAFNGSFKNTTEHVLRNCSLTSHGLHYYFTLLASILSTSFTPQALLEELAGSPGDVMRPISLSTTHSLAAVHQTVNTAAKTHLTACACLQHFINRLESAEPRRPMASDANVVDWVNRRLPPPKGGERIQFDVDPPSWIESYRTHRGLWKLELFHQIHNAATNHWLWSTHDLDCFIEQYMEWSKYPGGIEELQTISECVVELCSSKPTILSHRASYLVAVPSPTDLTVQTCWPLPNIQDTSVDSTWRRSPTFAEGRNAVLGYFNALRGGEKGRSYHALWKVDFKPFRRLGIPICDMWRLYQMRLMPQSRSVLSPRGNLVGGESEQTEWPPSIRAYVWFSLAEEGDVIVQPRK
ncbi:hypothetical protein PENPOL_c017G07933 [Penicillium polonicum]|uniref:F-box domain-containing protein n=1 Tax=Penicillium polonicum TaxID=60169 RepID=A0A1V6N9V2_PENPO|nr:hypothetical protein PENPOL_c017G07933 [Penicillium polonicum]